MIDEEIEPPQTRIAQAITPSEKPKETRPIRVKVKKTRRVSVTAASRASLLEVPMHLRITYIT